MSASAVLQLQKAGFSTEQVEALANFMDTQAASAADLERATSSTHRMIAEVRAELKAEIAEVRAEMRSEIGELRSEMRAEIGELRSEMRGELTGIRAEIADIRSEMRMLEQRMTIKLGGMMIVAVGVLMAAMRFMPPGG